MELRELIDKFRDILPKDHREDSDNIKFKTYNVFSGYLEDRYFDIYFRESLKGTVSIEITYTTKNPEYWTAIIKGIDPSVKILYAFMEIKYKIV